MRKTILVLAAFIVFTGCTAQNEIKIISFNIRQSAMSEYDGTNCWENRKSAVVKMIKKESPDILGIQEGLLEQVDFMKESLPSMGCIGVGRDDGKLQGEIMAIFYRKDRYDLEDSGTFWLSETPDSVSRGWDAACNRTATWVKLTPKDSSPDSRRSFFYFNTHLDHMGQTARIESAKLLVSKINEIAGLQSPIILCGDMNSTAQDTVITILRSAFTDSREQAPITDHNGTYNGWGTDSQTIDFIFGRNTTFTSFRTIDENFDVPFISDHYPIAATFSIE